MEGRFPSNSEKSVEDAQARRIAHLQKHLKNGGFLAKVRKMRKVRNKRSDAVVRGSLGKLHSFGKSGAKEANSRNFSGRRSQAYCWTAYSRVGRVRRPTEDQFQIANLFSRLPNVGNLENPSFYWHFSIRLPIFSDCQQHLSQPVLFGVFGLFVCFPPEPGHHIRHSFAKKRAPRRWGRPTRGRVKDLPAGAYRQDRFWRSKSAYNSPGLEANRAALSCRCRWPTRK